MRVLAVVDSYKQPLSGHVRACIAQGKLGTLQPSQYQCRRSPRAQGGEVTLHVDVRSGAASKWQHAHIDAEFPPDTHKEKGRITTPSCPATVSYMAAPVDWTCNWLLLTRGITAALPPPPLFAAAADGLLPCFLFGQPEQVLWCCSTKRAGVPWGQVKCSTKGGSPAEQWQRGWGWGCAMEG
jgi:hypothetical protein